METHFQSANIEAEAHKIGVIIERLHKDVRPVAEDFYYAESPTYAKFVDYMAERLQPQPISEKAKWKGMYQRDKEEDRMWMDRLVLQARKAFPELGELSRKKRVCERFIDGLNSEKCQEFLVSKQNPRTSFEDPNDLVHMCSSYRARMIQATQQARARQVSKMTAEQARKGNGPVAKKNEIKGEVNALYQPFVTNEDWSMDFEDEDARRDEDYAVQHAYANPLSYNFNPIQMQPLQGNPGQGVRGYSNYNDGSNGVSAMAQPHYDGVVSNPRIMSNPVSGDYERHPNYLY